MKTGRENLLVTAKLTSPIVGEIPHLDALLSHLMPGHRYTGELTRDTRLSEDFLVNIPCTRYYVRGGRFVWRCSDPITAAPSAVSTEYFTTKFDSANVLLLADDHRKTIRTTGGPYKHKRLPLTLRSLDCVRWFAVGNADVIRKLLAGATSIGKCRKIGYGLIHEWTVEVVDEDYSIFAEIDGRKILMRTLPADSVPEDVSGFRRSFGGYRPPYWHPENYCEIAAPC